MKIYLQQATPQERETLASSVGSSVGYFYLLAGGHRRPSTDLCKLLVEREPKLTLAELRPDVWHSMVAPLEPECLSDAELSRQKVDGVRQVLDPKQVQT